MLKPATRRVSVLLPLNVWKQKKENAMQKICWRELIQQNENNYWITTRENDGTHHFLLITKRSWKSMMTCLESEQHEVSRWVSFVFSLFACLVFTCNTRPAVTRSLKLNEKYHLICTLQDFQNTQRSILRGTRIVDLEVLQEGLLKKCSSCSKGALKFLWKSTRTH